MRSKTWFWLLFVLLLPCWGIALRPGTDLNVYYRVAQWLAAGNLANFYGESERVGNYFYGPLSLVFLSPVSHLSFGAFHWIYFALQTFAYVVFWIFLLRLFPSHLNRASGWIWFFVWAASIKPIHASFQCSNIQLFMGAGFVLSEWLSQQEKPRLQWWGGFLLSLIASIKLFPAFLCVFYILTKPRWVRVGVFSGAAAAFLVPLVFFGPSLGVQLHMNLLENLQRYHGTYSLADQTFFLSLPSLLATWLSPWLNMAVIEKITLLICGSIAGAFLLQSWRQRNDVAHASHRFALALAVLTFVNSSTRVDYYIFFVPLLCVVAEQWQTGRTHWSFKAAMAIAFSFMFLISEWTLQSREFNHQLEGWRLPVVGMTLLLIFSTRMRRLRPVFTESTSTQ